MIKLLTILLHTDGTAFVLVLHIEVHYSETQQNSSSVLLSASMAITGTGLVFFLLVMAI